MNILKAATILIGLAVGASSFAKGQGFMNLDFESAVVQIRDGFYGDLDWDLAAPGWGHSTGSDTQYIYYGDRHVGSSQLFFLVDSTAPVYMGQPLAGKYSLWVESGSITSGVLGPWVNAYISQTGLIPASAQSLRLLVVGPLQVFVGGIEVPLVSLGGNAYGGDISSFAGTTAELKLLNAAAPSRKDQSMIIDNIAFSTEPIPEASTATLMLLGAACLLLARQRR